MKYTGKIVVDREKAEKLEEFCKNPPGNCGDGEVLFDEEYTFENGNRVAVQVIASESPESESCWTQAVLYASHGYELSMTDVGESFLGEYFIKQDEDEYVVNVEIG